MSLKWRVRFYLHGVRGGGGWGGQRVRRRIRAGSVGYLRVIGENHVQDVNFRGERIKSIAGVIVPCFGENGKGRPPLGCQEQKRT